MKTAKSSEKSIIFALKVVRKFKKVGENQQKVGIKSSHCSPKENGRLSAAALAEKIGISAKAIEKHLASLKADGIIERIGPAKGGHWRVK